MAGYQGELDEEKVSQLIRDFGALLEGAGEVGFILTYHSVDGPGQTGTMDLAGVGIHQAQLEQLFREALAHNAEYGRTL